MSTTASTTARRAAASTLLAATLGASLLGVAGAPAQASGGDDRVERSGSCTGPGAARWKLKAKSDDGGIEVEGEVDSNRTGQTWTWVITQDGERVARGTSRTRGPSGSFSVERLTEDGAGADRFTFRAVRGDSGQVCAGALTF